MSVVPAVGQLLVHHHLPLPGPRESQRNGQPLEPNFMDKRMVYGGKATANQGPEACSDSPLGRQSSGFGTMLSGRRRGYQELLHLLKCARGVS